MNLSKSKYCSALGCPKKLWMGKYKPEEAVSKARDSVFKNGTAVGNLAKGLFGEYEDVEFNKDLNEMIEKTKQLLNQKPNIITEASFLYENNFCSVDILKNFEDGIEIYEVKSATSLKDINLDDVAYQYYVLSKLGFNIKKAYLVYINNKYIFHNKLEFDKLFIIEDITDIAKSKLKEIETNIKKINDYMNTYTKENEPESKLGMACRKPYVCDYWAYCTKDLPEPNVFDIFKMEWTKKFEKYEEGKISLEDLKNEKINEKFLEQINFELNNLEPKIDKEAIKELMASLKYPLYFLDFETFELAIPEYEGTWSYQQLPFQYSLHIIREIGAQVEHREFLAEADDRDFIRHFAESMIKDIPDNGSIIIYNNSFEPVRNRELSKMFPDLAKDLERINSNMVDFMVPFRKREYYMKEMKGSYSIKAVLPALYPNDPELDYHKLPVVHNGEEASDTFLSLRNKTKEEALRIREGLLEYCKLDTFAMVKIWERFMEIDRE